MSHQVFRSIDSGSVKGFAKSVTEAQAQVSWPNSLILIRHLYLIGVWLGVDLRTATKKTCNYKRLDGPCAQKLLTILGLIIVNFIEEPMDHMIGKRTFALIMNKIFL